MTSLALIEFDTMSHFCRIGVPLVLIVLFARCSDTSPGNTEQLIVTEGGAPHGGPVSKSMGSPGGTIQSSDEVPGSA